MVVPEGPWSSCSVMKISGVVSPWLRGERVGVARRIVREDVDVWRKTLPRGDGGGDDDDGKGRCGHVTRLLCVFYLVDGMQGATATPANSCKEFAHLGSSVHAGALSTPSSTPANYHLSRATSLRNQFLPRRGERCGGERGA